MWRQYSKSIILKLVVQNSSFGNCSEIVLRWIPQNRTHEKSILVQAMAWCHQVTSHYLSQCWPRSMSPYSVTGHNELTMDDNPIQHHTTTHHYTTGNPKRVTHYESLTGVVPPTSITFSAPFPNARVYFGTDFHTHGSNFGWGSLAKGIFSADFGYFDLIG